MKAEWTGSSLYKGNILGLKGNINVSLNGIDVS